MVENFKHMNSMGNKLLRFYKWEFDGKGTMLFIQIETAILDLMTNTPQISTPLNGDLISLHDIVIQKMKTYGFND